MRKLKISSYFCLSLVMVIGFITIVASGGGSSSGSSDDGPIDPSQITPSTITTFSEDEGSTICTEEGKPIIRMYTSATCQFCAWSAETFDPVVQWYMDQGLIVAHHWNVTTGDDLLTSEVEGEIPEDELEILYTNNPTYGVPKFDFGCIYYRVGAPRYYEDNQEAEAAELMAVIEELLDAVQ